MERITYVLLNSVTENRARFLWFVNQLLPCPERAIAPQCECASGVPVPGSAEFAAEKEGRTAPSSPVGALRQGGPPARLKIAVDSCINGQGMARESR